MEDMMFSLADLAWFILFVIAAAAGIYLIITLRHLSRLIRSSGELLEGNRENLNASLEMLPDVIENIQDITETVREGVDKTEEAIDHIGGSLTEAVATAANSIDNIAAYSKIIREVIRIVMDILPPRSKK